MNKDIDTVRQQLRELESLHAGGVLDNDAYVKARAGLERRLLDMVLAAPSASTHAAAPVPSAASTASTAFTQASSPPEPQTSGPSLNFMAKLAAGVVAIAAMGYVAVGNPQLLGDSAPGTAGAANATNATNTTTGDAANAPHELGSAQIAAMTDKLAARLKDNPQDGDGWAMLARSFAVLGQHDKAVPAFRKALEINKEDPVLLADFADALAMTQARSLKGEPMGLVARALKADPNNIKALSLAGTAAFDNKDYALAVKHWEKMRSIAPADSPFVKQIESGINEARQLAGMPPGSATATPALAPAAAGSGAAAGPLTSKVGSVGSAVSGTVTLATALASKAAPQDTVFIFARPADGSRMPLAIIKKQVKDLPYTFTLDDSTAMSPAATLSMHKQVVVGARVSKSGQATPQPGDLQGQSGAVPLGSKGLQISIAELVAP